MRNETRFAVMPSFYILLALTVLILPIRWVGAWVVAAFFHELCHYAVLRLFHCKVYSVQVHACGAIMQTEPLRSLVEILSSLAGPLGGFALLLFARHFPAIAICGFFQSFYNLIPLFPLDGGRAVCALTRKIFPNRIADRIIMIIENAVAIIFLLIGIYGTFLLKLGTMPLVLSAVLILQNKKRKTTCKALV